MQITQITANLAQKDGRTLQVYAQRCTNFVTGESKAGWLQIGAAMRLEDFDMTTRKFQDDCIARLAGRLNDVPVSELESFLNAAIYTLRP